MTDEELEKKAEEYSNWLYHSKAWNPGEDMLVKAYLAGAKEVQEENEQLKQQIEEMKNCYNCSNFCDRNVDCSSICVRNNPTVKQLKDYWKMKDIY